jgi:hypothetical protein
MRKRAANNSTYPKGGVSCFADSFLVAESSVLRMKFIGKNPALRVAAKRQSQSSICREIGNANNFHQTPFGVFCWISNI